MRVRKITCLALACHGDDRMRSAAAVASVLFAEEVGNGDIEPMEQDRYEHAVGGHIGLVAAELELL